MKEPGKGKAQMKMEISCLPRIIQEFKKNKKQKKKRKKRRRLEFAVYG